MEIKKIDHISIIVKDLNKSLEFYGKILNFKLIKTIKKEHQILRHFEISNNQFIELNEYLYDVDDHKGKLNDRGTYRHLALEVTNIEDWEQILTLKGYPFHIPVAIDKTSNLKNGLFLDPNGVEIELIEYLK